jgi:hypothetical protein
MQALLGACDFYYQSCAEQRCTASFSTRAGQAKTVPNADDYWAEAAGMPHSLSRLFRQLCVQLQLVVEVPATQSSSTHIMVEVPELQVSEKHRQHTYMHQGTRLHYCACARYTQSAPAFVICCFKPARSWCRADSCVWKLLHCNGCK